MKRLIACSVCLLLAGSVMALAQAGTAAATQEKPYVNSLGMKFVPVSGPQLLFSIWDTRVRDYRAYAKANTGVDASWQKFATTFKQGDDHPVVDVSWNEANAFCAWLTQKERKEGRLGNDQQYRLPTDDEWTIAVGIGTYPWGYVWPPLKNAGNYGPFLKVDKYEYTSPVGSFRVNQYGLYDMGGNVWQWCEDWYRTDMNANSWYAKNPQLMKIDKGEGKSRVARGAGWNNTDPQAMLSLSRNGGAPSSRNDEFGFRCVLASTPDLSALKPEDLISMLQEESNPEILKAGFTLLEYHPDLLRTFMGYATLPVPVVSPVMRELERRGTAALPALLAHVSDPRPTRVLVGVTGYGVSFNNWYAPRVLAKDRMPIHLPPAPDNAKVPRIDQFHYNLKVGDLCYAAIGVIVNRNLYVAGAMGNVPGDVVNSPVVCPQLAAAVRADWSGLTPAGHQKSLDQDGWLALKELLFYYPQAGIAKAIKELGGEFYDYPAIWQVGDFPSTEFDHAVYDLLKRVAAKPASQITGDDDQEKFDHWQNKFNRFGLVCACAWRLTPPDGREALLLACQDMARKYPQPNAGAAAVAAFDARFDKFLQDEIAKLAPK